MAVHAGRIRGTVDQVWIGRYRMRGVARLYTALHLEVRGPVDLPRLEYHVDRGDLFVGEERVFADVRFDASARLDPFTPRGRKAADVIRALSGTFDLDARDGTLKFLEIYFRKAQGLRLVRGGQRAEAALPAVELTHRDLEVRRAEVGPHGRREVQLGVGAFPQQEIGQPLIAAGADDDVIGRDVPVQEIGIVDDLERIEQRPDDRIEFLLSWCSAEILQPGLEIFSFLKMQHHVGGVVRAEDAVHFDDVAMIELRERLRLVDEAVEAPIVIAGRTCRARCRLEVLRPARKIAREIRRLPCCRGAFIMKFCTILTASRH